MEYAQLALIAGGGFAAGAVNALAGGGTLITFPVLVAAGLPPLSANVTNTIALCPGYLGATLAQAADLRGQQWRLSWTLPTALIGGLLGALLLLHTSERAFDRAVPWLILAGCTLLGFQERLRTALRGRDPPLDPARGAASHRVLGGRAALLPLVAAAAAYGGYFGAGMSVIVLAVLGLMLEDTLPRLNALKQSVALAANSGAALWLAARAPVNWGLVALLAVSALLGGSWGGRLARRLSPVWLRRVVVSLGVGVAGVFLYRGGV